MTYISGSGEKITLGKKLGGGGEGYVAELSSHSSSLVAKIYHQQISGDKQQKLILMTQMSNKRLIDASAWPVDVLYDKNKSIQGFLMQNLGSYKPIHNVYSPADRKKLFPNHDWAFLINVARNVASVFSVMHQSDIVIGDVNQSSVFVSNDGTVKLIDCDSFQIKKGDKIYPCIVGQREFAPPELRTALSLDTVQRTPNHDNFCLAILIFSLLLMGKHPFSGVYSGSGDMPIEKAIENSLYAYSLDSKNKLLSPPPGNILPSILSIQLMGNFEKSFSKSGILEGRPSAIKWLQDLDVFKNKLCTCGHDPIHKYYSALKVCPWCQSENERSHIFFISKIEIVSINDFDIKNIWGKIEQIVPPGPVPTIQTKTVFPKPLPTEIRQAKFRYILKKALIICSSICVITIYPAIWFIVLFIGISLVSSVKNEVLQAEIQTRRISLTSAQTAMDQTMRLWKKILNNEGFWSKKAELQQYKTSYENLSLDFEREKTQLRQQVRQNQLKRFLAEYHIADYEIRSIGYARKAMLRSFAVETAADIQYENILKISGFGPYLADILDSWRKTIEKRFVFDPTKGIDPVDLNALKQRFSLREKELTGKLLAGPEELNLIKQTILADRQRLLPQMEQLSLNLAQAISDMKIVEIK